MSIHKYLVPLLPLLMGTPSLAYTAEINGIKNITSSSLEWEKTPEGVAFAPLVGQRFNEAYMAMVSLPPGTISPPHTKSSNMFGVVVSGAMVHNPLDLKPEK